MTAGLPGIGIGGIFYLVSALMMPLVELKRRLRRRKHKKSWRLILKHFSYVLGIAGGFWAMGYLLTLPIRELSQLLSMPQANNTTNVFQIKPLYVSLAVLTFVFGSLALSNVILDARDKLFRKNKKIAHR